VAAGLAALKNLDLYLALERLMLELDASEDPIADQVRDLLDPVWYRLSPDEKARMDARGQIDPSGLFPVRLPVPPRPQQEEPTVRDQRFDHVSWEAPADWRKKAA
jgi:hypothetical protein